MAEMALAAPAGLPLGAAKAFSALAAAGGVAERVTGGMA